MSATKIEWTEFSWNPVRGCSRKGAGCENCYAERMAARFGGPDDQTAGYIDAIKGVSRPFRGFATMTPSGPRWTGRVELIEHKLDEPLRRRKATTYFVNSMSDLWHPALPLRDKARIYAVMALCQEQNLGHLFHVLTKRPAERLAAFRNGEFWDMVEEEMDRICGQRYWCAPGLPDPPLPNIWEGVSISTQEDADRDIPILLQTPAVLRMLSYEPALGPVDFREYIEGPELGRALLHHHRTGHDCGSGYCEQCPATWHESVRPRWALDWLVAGGESGPGARPYEIQWFRSARDQCKSAGVPFFMKQLTERGLKIPFERWPEDLRVREMPEMRR